MEELAQETERLRAALAQAQSRAHTGAQALQAAKVDRALSTQTLQEVSIHSPPACTLGQATIGHCLVNYLAFMTASTCERQVDVAIPFSSLCM